MFNITERKNKLNYDAIPHYSTYKGSQLNQLRADLMSICALNPWPGHDSSSRVQMFSSHLGQRLVIKGATERRCQTGMEAEFGKYNFSTKMPEDGHIIRVIDRYKRTLDKDSINVNPQTIVIFEEDKTNRIGMIDLRTFSTYHQYFGYENVVTSNINKLVPRQFIKKDTEFLKTPTITEDGGYKYGIELNMVFLGVPSIAEDGIMICEDVLPKLAFKIYETRVVEFGNKKFPINLYGDENNFKAFPDIGEYIKDTGVLMMLRSYEKNMSIVEQSIYDLMEPEYTFDTGVYVNGPGGKVVDIRIWHDEDSQSPTPIGMDKQAQKYNQATKSFYREIVNEYKRLYKERGKALSLTPEFNRMVIEAMAAIEDTETNKISKLYKRTQLDDYKLEFVIEYEIIPTIGYKLTDCHGGR